MAIAGATPGPGATNLSQAAAATRDPHARHAPLVRGALRDRRRRQGLRFWRQHCRRCRPRTRAHVRAGVCALRRRIARVRAGRTLTEDEMDYTRRDLLALMGTAGALGRSGDAAAQDSGLRTPHSRSQVSSSATTRPCERRFSHRLPIRPVRTGAACPISSACIRQDCGEARLCLRIQTGARGALLSAPLSEGDAGDVGPHAVRAPPE